ncbi:MAG: permease-like cell division protein FtsX, partial [Pseudoflavonifractor sp.]
MKHQINVGYFISEGFHSIFTHGLMSFAAVCMIVACLLIMGSFSLVAVNVGNMLGDLEAENEFFAYVDETIPKEQVQALGKKLKAVPNVSEITFISKEEAKADFAKKYAESETADVFQDLPDEVYRDRYSIHVVDIEQFGETVSAVEAMKADGVAKVRAESDVATGFVVVRNIASGVAVILI